MLSGSQGVIRADDAGACAAAVARVRRILNRSASPWQKDPDFHRLLVEDYVQGSEIAVEALLDAGRLEPLAVFDKPDELVGPFFEETLYVTPSRHAPAAIERACAVAEQAARALGLDRARSTPSCACRRAVRHCSRLPRARSAAVLAHAAFGAGRTLEDA